MDREEYCRLWDHLHADLQGAEDITNSRPLLAHYTSMPVIESILKNDEFWMSNPLNMNDVSEVRGAIFEMRARVANSEILRQAFGDEEGFDEFVRCYDFWVRDYGETEGFDLYVGCFARHSSDCTDGKLAMWRGYGDYGNGAAIVFDTSKIEAGAANALVFAPVTYASYLERAAYLDRKLQDLSDYLLQDPVPHHDIKSVANCFFRRILLFSIFTKHEGFSEEREWRLVYMKDRDQSGHYSSMFSYFNGPRGLEPKLKLKLLNVLGSEDALADSIHSIIIGPRRSSPLNIYAAKKNGGRNRQRLPC